MSETVSALQAAEKAGHLLPAAAKNLRSWLESGALPDWAQSALTELVKDGQWEELNNRFYQYMAFGTGGMRGRTIGEVMASAETGTPGEQGTPAHPAVGTAYLNDFNVVRATVGLYRYCRQAQEKNPGEFADASTCRLVIAHDVRHFSRHFSDLAASTWTKLGGEAWVFNGPRSTPQLSFAVRQLKATAGVVITASHNPSHDNGYKAYFHDGAQVTPPHDKGIIAEVEKVELSEVPPFLEIDRSNIRTLDASADRDYLEAVLENVLDREVITAQKPKVVFTAIHGTGGVASVPALKELGVEVQTVAEQDVMDPRFPTVKSPNPENAPALQMAIDQAMASGADVLLGTDPDADRMGVAVRDPESGEMTLLSGNMIGSLLAAYRIGKLKERGLLPRHGTQRAALVKTFVTTPLQAKIAEGHGLKVINTLTGFKWIGQKLKDWEDGLLEALAKQIGSVPRYDAIPYSERVQDLLKHSTFYVFGGEESYGYLASDRVRDKDANAAVVMFCELAAALQAEGKSFPQYLDEIYLRYGYYTERLVNLYYEGATGAQKIRNILDSYRADPPQELAGARVTEVTDFGRAELYDPDGRRIPQQDFFTLELDNGCSFAVRGSGTEPKIKFYLFGSAEVSEPAALAEIKEQAAATLKEMAEAVEADARERAEREDASS